MGSFSETLIDAKDLRHDNKQVYYCIYTIQSTVGKKTTTTTPDRALFSY